MLLDSAGRYWLDCSGYGWRILLPDGRVSDLCPNEFAMSAPVIEQGPNVYWAFGSNGLLRLRVDEPKGGKPKIVIDKQYPRLIPQDGIKFLGLDGHNNLWMATRSGRSGLYRIELPPLPDSSAKGARP